MRLKRVDWQALTPAPIIGVDEVGRGCLAGPVVAAAVILQSTAGVRFFTDSKLLSERRREELFATILVHHRVGIGFATPEEIDRINILQASFLAMRRALAQLEVSGGHVLVDGHLPISQLDMRQTPLIKGDLRCKPISAASIVAKVTRDRFMRGLAEKIPGYGFEIHKGYPTTFHRARLVEKGPSHEHRRTFRGVELTTWVDVGSTGPEVARLEELADRSAPGARSARRN